MNWWFSINGGTPEWLVYCMENPIISHLEMDENRGYLHFRKPPYHGHIRVYLDNINVDFVDFPYVFHGFPVRSALWLNVLLLPTAQHYIRHAVVLCPRGTRWCNRRDRCFRWSPGEVQEMLGPSWQRGLLDVSLIQVSMRYRKSIG